MKRSAWQLVLVMAVAVVASACSTIREDEVSVAWDTVPAVVQSTIQAHTFGGTVCKVEQETTGCGVVYEAKVAGKEDTCSEIEVAADGTLLKYKVEKKSCPMRGDK